MTINSAIDELEDWVYKHNTLKIEGLPHVRLGSTDGGWVNGLELIQQIKNLKLAIRQEIEKEVEEREIDYHCMSKEHDARVEVRRLHASLMLLKNRLTKGLGSE